MRHRLLFVMALGLMVVATGCATALNIQDAALRKPYGGVAMSITDFFGGSDSGEASEYASLFFWPFWVFDKPLSLFADTLTLPYTLYSQRNTQSSQPNHSPQSTLPSP